MSFARVDMVMRFEERPLHRGSVNSPHACLERLDTGIQSPIRIGSFELQRVIRPRVAGVVCKKQDEAADPAETEHNDRRL